MLLHSQPGSYYDISSLRDVHHQMWKAKVFSRLERTHIPGRENSKSQGVATTSDSGRGGSSGIRGDIENRDPRAVGSSRRHKEDESIGQLSVYIG